MKHPAVKNAGMVERGEDHYHLVASTRGSMEGIEVEREVMSKLGIDDLRKRRFKKKTIESSKG